MFHVLIIIAFIAIALAAVYFSYLAAKKRREEMAALARELGWQFDPDHNSFHDEQYANFEIFRRGRDRSAYNTLQGSLTIDGRAYPARMGDFTYKVTSGSGKNRRTRTYHFSYFIAHLPFTSVPDMLIRREGVLDKLAGVFGFDDIDFESAEFSRKFHVKSADKRFAYDVCHPRMMEFLLANCPTCVDIECNKCCLSDGASRWQPSQFKSMIAWIEQFFDHWPDHLTAQIER